MFGKSCVGRHYNPSLVDKSWKQYNVKDTFDNKVTEIIDIFKCSKKDINKRLLPFVPVQMVLMKTFYRSRGCSSVNPHWELAYGLRPSQGNGRGRLSVDH